MSVSTVIYASFPVTQDNTVIVDPNNQAIEAPASEPDWALFIVCLFFGTLGIHRFMMGDTTSGILMLLTFGGCGIWALIDLIRIATGDLRR